MSTYFRLMLKATAFVIISLCLPTLMNFVISLVFMIDYETIQQSPIWIVHFGVVAVLLFITGKSNESK
jgi:hypothetical protein